MGEGTAAPTATLGNRPEQDIARSRCKFQGLLPTASVIPCFRSFFTLGRVQLDTGGGMLASLHPGEGTLASLHPGEGMLASLHPGEGMAAFLHPGGAMAAFLHPGGAMAAFLHPGGAMAALVPRQLDDFRSFCSEIDCPVNSAAF